MGQVDEMVDPHNSKIEPLPLKGLLVFYRHQKVFPRTNFE